MAYKNKEDQKAYYKEWYAKNREKVLDRMKPYNKERRKTIEAWFRNYKETLSCEFCGEDSSECLDFHHKDPTDKRFTIGCYSMMGVSIDTLQQEIAKCIILCANCHRKLHAGTLGE